jgi:hypothetical protein
VFIFTQPCGSRCYLNNLPAMRPGPREAGKQSGRSFATATLCFYKPGQGVLFDPVAKDLKDPTLIQTLCYAVGMIMVIRRTVLRLSDFLTNIGGRRRTPKLRIYYKYLEIRHLCNFR